RASSRFAMLAQAMSSTNAVTPSNRRSGVFASSGIELWPRPPGATRMGFSRKRASVCGLMSFCSGASTSLRIAWYWAPSDARGGDPDSRPQAREQVRPIVRPERPVGVGVQHRAQRDRGEHGRPYSDRRAVEALWRDADDGQTLAVDDDLFVENRGIEPE